MTSHPWRARLFKLPPKPDTLQFVFSVKTPSGARLEVSHEGLPKEQVEAAWRLINMKPESFAAVQAALAKEGLSLNDKPKVEAPACPT